MTSVYQGISGPEFTPKAIQYLIIVTLVTSILAALTNPLFTQIFGIPGLQTWLSLSWEGFSHFLLWQPLTYPFVQSGGSQGIGIFFLILLTFNMYLLWFLGSEILNYVGSKAFLVFYFLSTLIAGMAALAMMKLTGYYTVLAGPSAPLLALFTVWTMIHPEATLLLFFAFPAKAKWLFVGVISAILLVALSQFDWISFAVYLSSVVFAYFYAILVWNFTSPFAWTFKIDQFLIRKKESKIFDIHTGEPKQDDDEFVDAMLAKISRKGESSLTRNERKRMQEIAEKKKNKQARNK